MLIRYGDELVQATPRFIAALEELMEAELEMMRRHRGDSTFWAWGRCIVHNLASPTAPYEFH